MGPGDLGHEGIRLQAETEHRDPQDHLPVERDVVLSQGVADRVEREGVVATVDLHDEADVLPGDIEVDAPTSCLAHHLTRGWG